MFKEIVHIFYHTRAVNRVWQEFQNKCLPKILGGGLLFSRSYRIRLSQDSILKNCFYQFLAHEFKTKIEQPLALLKRSESRSQPSQDRKRRILVVLSNYCSRCNNMIGLGLSNNKILVIFFNTE